MRRLALLFPMEKVFESYVATKLRRNIGRDISLLTQDSRYSLIDSPTPAFALRPDIVLKSSDCTVVLDTKWKLLSDNARYNGISQTDMYQMYAYQKKYDAKSVTLIYPRTDKVNAEKDIAYSDKDGVTVKVKFVDLFNVTESLKAIIKDFSQTQS